MATQYRGENLTDDTELYAMLYSSNRLWLQEGLSELYLGIGAIGTAVVRRQSWYVRSHPQSENQWPHEITHHNVCNLVLEQQFCEVDIRTKSIARLQCERLCQMVLRHGD